MPFALNPLKAEIASEIAKAVRDCCIEQYKCLQTDPVIIELYEEPVIKAAIITEPIVRDIKKMLSRRVCGRGYRNTRPTKQTERGKH
jgi:hypothetical protein